jgi:biopolymer transport protein ExbB
MTGISEALVATAVGLFVAIPAVLAFNIFQRLLKRVIGRSNALGNAIASGLHVKNGSK